MVVSGLAGVLAGCGGLTDGGIFANDFWRGGAVAKNNLAEFGLAELAKGNRTGAERWFKTALRRNPRDVDALLGLGILYQNTGQKQRAKEMYEAVLAIRPAKNVQMVVWNSITPRPISEIASVNLALLESGGVLTDMGRAERNNIKGGYAKGSAAGPFIPGGPVVSGASSARAMIARPVRRGGAQAGEAARVSLPGGEANAVARFRILSALRKQGLITEAEYAARRQANIGALLPLTSPPPAAGLDRSVPSSAQISGRLRAIARGLELRALTVSQYSAERTMILNALMPAAPVAVANPGPPPKGLMQAADAVRGLEYLKEQGIITSDEYTKERKAIERALQPAGTAPPKAAAIKSAGPRPAVHLASYRTRRQAERGWKQLRGTYHRLLGGLESEITKTNLGRGRGIFYRLKAGPLASEKKAKALCGKLKKRRQYCRPTFMENG
jgi:tetratricopeptide (TPR) repeat protein